MKKITYFLPILVILIAGCAQQDVQEPGEPPIEPAVCHVESRTN